MRYFEMTLTEGMTHKAVINDSLPLPEVNFSLCGLRQNSVLDLGTHQIKELGYDVSGYIKWLEYVGYKEIKVVKPVRDWKDLRDYGLSCMTA